MAALTWFVTDALADVHAEMSESDPGAEAYGSPVTGWVVGTGVGNHAAMDSQVELTATAFASTTPPDGTPDTVAGDCFRSTNAYSGTFDAGNWNVHFAARAQTQGGAQDGRMRCRLLRGSDPSGSGATEITGAQQQGGLVTNLTTSATQVSTATFDPGSFSVTAEYLFVQIAWERTGAGGMAASDVNLRIGNASGAGSRVISANFTSSAAPEDPYSFAGGGFFPAEG